MYTRPDFPIIPLLKYISACVSCRHRKTTPGHQTSIPSKTPSLIEHTNNLKSSSKLHNCRNKYYYTRVCDHNHCIILEKLNQIQIIILRLVPSPSSSFRYFLCSVSHINQSYASSVTLICPVVNPSLCPIMSSCVPECVLCDCGGLHQAPALTPFPSHSLHHFSHDCHYSTYSFCECVNTAANFPTPNHVCFPAKYCDRHM